MEAAERTISQILTEQIRYEIPAYQRPYSWEKGNVEQLLDDIWEAYEAQDEEYLLGRSSPSSAKRADFMTWWMANSD